LARELSVDSVSVAGPLGAAARTAPTSPVTGSARFDAIKAAFCSPGAGPDTAPPERNCAIANPAATVVRSLTTATPVTGDVPSTVASVTAPSGLVASRYTTDCGSSGAV
jgi:hypothetical protein